MKKIALLLLTIGMIFCLASCDGDKDYADTTNGRLIEIVGQNDLYYDTNTKVVYIIWNEWHGETGYGYMSPYYSSNGLPYLYNAETGYLEEIHG